MWPHFGCKCHKVADQTGSGGHAGANIHSQDVKLIMKSSSGSWTQKSYKFIMCSSFSLHFLAFRTVSRSNDQR